MSDFLKALPDNQKVLERDDRWRKMLEKGENCGDCEEDGYDICDLIACCEVEDEENEELLAIEEEAIESDNEPDGSKENNRAVVVYEPKTIQDVENVYDTDYIKGLKRAFNQRCSELDQMNLHFWKRSKTQEGFNESNIKTPNFEASTRSFFRSSEQECSSGKKSQQLSPKSFKMPHPVNFNHQFANYPQNMDQSNTFDARFPFQLNDVMNGSQKINIRIREMHYDLSVDGRDVTEFFIPNCNSTYKNAIPALGNLTINNTIPNIQNFQVLRPAITYDVEQIRSEPAQKVNEKPDLDLSNVESLNSSVIDTFEEIKICDSSREGYNSKGKNKKTYKKKAQKKYPKKRKQKLKPKDVKCEIVPVNNIVSTSEKLELSYSDVVKLSPKNNLRQTKNSKPANDKKKQVELQQNKKNSGEMLKSYRRIIDPDTSTEDIVEEKMPIKSNKKDEKLIQPKKLDIPAIHKDVKNNEKPVDPKQSGSEKSKDVIEEKVSTKSKKKDEKLNQPKKVDIPAIYKDVKKNEKSVDVIEEKVSTKSNKKDEKFNQPKKVDIPAIYKDVKNNEKPVDVKQSESQKSKVVVKTESSMKTREKENNYKEDKKSKANDKPETSNKPEVQKKPSKSYKSKENNKLVEMARNKMSTKSQEEADNQPMKTRGATEKQMVKQKSNENEKKQQEEKSCKSNGKSSKDLKSGGKKEPDLQYDENGVPFRNVGGFVLRYEENNSDSDSSVDDTEFFRRVHAEIREKNALSKK